MPQPWPAREVEVVLPIATAKAMFERARRFDVERGGRFDARGAAVLLWSTSDQGEGGEPVGCFYVRWHDPLESLATLWKIEWDPEQGGSEAEVWTALELLSGGAVRRS